MREIKTIAEMATALNNVTDSSRYKSWEKGDKKRIYIHRAGYNTKKMETKVYIDLSGTAPYIYVHIDCPSQHQSWIDSQCAEIRERYAKQARYCRMHFDFSVSTQPIEVIMNNATLDAESVKGYYTEWRNVRVAINSFGKLATRNRQFVIAFEGTKNTAPRGFMPLGDAGYDLLKAKGEDMLEPYGFVPDYDSIAAYRAEYLAGEPERKRQAAENERIANEQREQKVKVLHDVDEAALANMAALIAAGNGVLQAWKASGCPHPAPREVMEAKLASGLNWKKFAETITDKKEDQPPFEL